MALSGRRVWLVSFVICLGLGTAWSFATPVLANPDEPAHAVKAAALVRGQLVPPKLDLPDEGEDALLRGGFTTLVQVPASYSWQTSQIPECYIWDSTASAACAPSWVDDPSPAEWTAYIGRYPPTYYALVGWTTLLDTGVAGFYGMRVASAVLTAALLATAMAVGWSARRFRLVPVGVAAAATPQVFIMAGSVNPNSLEAAAGICAWVAVCVALLWEGPRVPRSVVCVTTASASFLATSRPLSTMWLAAITVAALCTFGDRDRVLSRLRERDVRVGVGSVFLLSLAGATWTVLSDALGNNRGYNPWGLGLFDAAVHSLSLTWSYLQQSVAAFGWLRTPGPALATVAWGVVFAMLAILGLRVADRRRRAALAGVTAMWLMAPTLMQAPTAKAFGFVWSGRYGLALAAGVPIVASLIAGERERSDRVERGVAAAALVLVASIHVVAVAAALRRFIVGTDGAWNIVGAGGWRPPLGAGLLLAMTVLFAVGLSVLAYRAAARAPSAGAVATTAA